MYYCMHPYTVYGIETQYVNELFLVKKHIACTLIPFTVLKPRQQLKTSLEKEGDCMHPYTVYGIETSAAVRVVLKEPNCMHPYTVYGIETAA